VGFRAQVDNHRNNPCLVCFHLRNNETRHHWKRVDCHRRPGKISNEPGVRQDSTTVQQNNIVSQKIESFISAQPEVSTVFSNVGGPSTGIGSLGLVSANKSELTIQLKPGDERANQPTEEFMKEIREALRDEFPGINYSMAAMGLVPRSAPIEITLSGSDASQVMQLGSDLKSVVEKIPGADNVRLSVEEGSPEFQIIPDNDRMQRLGLTTVHM
jgi:HAE1 family hydrophobic/amphiphilic exporter-1